MTFILVLVFFGPSLYINMGPLRLYSKAPQGLCKGATPETCWLDQGLIWLDGDFRSHLRGWMDP